MTSLLTVDQAADLLGASPRFIRRLIAQHRITFVRPGGHIRFDRADLDTFTTAGRGLAGP